MLFIFKQAHYMYNEYHCQCKKTKKLLPIPEASEIDNSPYLSITAKTLYWELYYPLLYS